MIELVPVRLLPISPTLDQKVAFRLLIKKIGHQSNVKLHVEVG